MKLVFICSPLRGDLLKMKQNQLNAMNYAQVAVEQGYLPIVPHIYFPQFLDENNPKDRDLSIQMGINLLKRCDELWLMQREKTEGMRLEINAALHLGIPIEYKFPCV